MRALFAELIRHRVLLEGIVLKANMVLAGLAHPQQPAVDEVASAIVQCLLRSVPAAVPAIAFLSGGQSSPLASERLNAINAGFRSAMPWAVSFSFARALQQPALEIWGGDNAHSAAAQAALNRRAQLSRAARRGETRSEMESA
ncbi:MAG: class I fructose-bisphosphate aldolase [Rubrivivax sp.]